MLASTPGTFALKEELLLGLPVSVRRTQGKQDGDPRQRHVGRQKPHLAWQGQAVQGEHAGDLHGEGVASAADTRMSVRRVAGLLGEAAGRAEPAGPG